MNMSLAKTPSASPDGHANISFAVAAGSPDHLRSPPRGVKIQVSKKTTMALPRPRIVTSPTKTPPPAFDQKPFKKDRSFRRAVVEKKLLTRNGLAAINERSFIVRKTLDRKYNPHKLTIAKKGREWTNGCSDPDDDEDLFVPNSNIVQNGGSTSSAASSSAGQRTSLLGNPRVRVPIARRMPPKGSTPLPYMRAGSHRAAVRLPVDIPAPPDLMAGPFKNSPLVRQTTDPWIPPSENSASSSNATASSTSNDAGVVQQSEPRGSKTPPLDSPMQDDVPIRPPDLSDVLADIDSIKPPAIVGLSRKKTEPFIAPSPAAPPFPASPAKRSVTNVGGQPTRGNLSSKVPPQVNRLVRNETIRSIPVAKSPSHISPPKTSEPVLTPTTASGHLAPQTRQASNPGLRRQDTIHVPQSKGDGSEGAKENDSDKAHSDGEDGQPPAAPNDDDGNDDEDDQGNGDNRSFNGEEEEAKEEEEEEEEESDDDMYSEYDEHATFNDFFPDQKILLPEHLATFAPTQLYTAEPPADFEGDLADWIETMYEGICHEVKILEEFVQHARAHANNAYAETGLTKKDLHQAQRLMEIFERDMRKLAGENFYAYYQELLASGAGDPSDEENPPLQFTFADELRVNPKNRIVPREEANDGTYMVTPPLSEADNTNNAPAPMPYEIPRARSTPPSSPEELDNTPLATQLANARAVAQRLSQTPVASSKTKERKPPSATQKALPAPLPDSSEDEDMPAQVASARSVAFRLSKPPTPLEKRKSPPTAQRALPALSFYDSEDEDTPAQAASARSSAFRLSKPPTPLEKRKSPPITQKARPSPSPDSSEEEDTPVRMVTQAASARSAAFRLPKPPTPFEKRKSPPTAQKALPAPSPDSSDEEDTPVRMFTQGPGASVRSAAFSLSKVPAPFEGRKYPPITKAALPIPAIDPPTHAPALFPSSLPHFNTPRLTEDNHLSAAAPPLVPEPPVVHGYKRPREDDSIDMSISIDSSKNQDTEKREDRPVIKRMRFRAPSTSGLSDEEMTEDEKDTPAVEKKTIDVLSSSPLSSPPAKKVVQEERPIRPLPAPRSSFGSALSAALRFFRREEEQPEVKKEFTGESFGQAQAQSSTEAAAHPETTAPEHEVIDVDTYEYVENVPQPSQSRPFLLPQRRTINPRPVHQGPTSTSNLPNNLWRSGSGNLNIRRPPGSVEGLRQIDVHAGSGLGVQRRLERRSTFGGRGASFEQM